MTTVTSDMDVFPQHLSYTLKNLDYPKDRFKSVVAKRDLQIFIVYLNESNHTIEYFQCAKERKYLKSILTVGKEAAALSSFEDEEEIVEVSGDSMAKRLAKEPNRPLKNTDVRVGFKFDECCFLVKQFFTFGQRTVQPNEAHVFQTTNIPLHLLVKGGPDANRLRMREKSFSVADLSCYHKRILLPPRGCYRIPPGTTYLIVSPQNIFFSVHRVPANMELPIPWRDPVGGVQNNSPISKRIFVAKHTPLEENEKMVDEGQESSSSSSSSSSSLTPMSSTTTTTSSVYEHQPTPQCFMDPSDLAQWGVDNNVPLDLTKSSVQQPSFSYPTTDSSVLLLQQQASSHPQYYTTPTPPLSNAEDTYSMDLENVFEDDLYDPCDSANVDALVQNLKEEGLRTFDL